MPRDWQTIGQFTVTPGSTRVDVGVFDIDPGDDCLWINLQRIGGDDSWPWSYGIIGWRTPFGYELGSVKAYTELVGQVSRLSVGCLPRSTIGMLTYEPRSYNLAWIKKGYPLTLEMSVSSGASVGAGVPAGTSIAFSVEGKTWTYSAKDGFAHLNFN